MSEKRITIYGLISSDAPEAIRYVGQTWQRLSRRLVLHRYQSKNVTAHTPVGKWIRSKLENGLEIRIIVLKENAKWDTDEIKMIRELKAKGCKLLNLSEGGQGTHPQKLSTEARAKISKALKGKPKSAEARKNMSLCRIGKPLSEAHRKSLSESHKGIPMSEKNKKELSKRMLGNKFAAQRVWTDAQRKHRSEIAKAQWARVRMEA